MNRYLLTLLCLLATLCIASAVLAEGFTPLPIDDSPGLAPAQENFLTDGEGYQDASISVRIERTRAYDTEIVLAYVTIADASQMRTAMAGRYGTTKVVGPQILAERTNCVFGVNGDFFNYRTTGYLIRQGQLYRDRADATFDLLLIDDAGDFHILRDPTPEAAHSFPGTVINTFNFGPALVIEGEPVLPVKVVDSGTMIRAQRMAACQLGPLSYLFVATEGPENKGSVGLTVEELVTYCHSLGVQTAYNLDGGSSTSMMLGKDKVNGIVKKHRQICDMLYFSTLIPAEASEP